MTYAILSDIHANPDALRRVLDDARCQGAQKIVSLGDIVGYGPLPEAALAMLRSSAEVSLAGNHDDAVSGRLDAADFIDLASDAVNRHRNALSKADLARLADLPYTASLEGARCTHGDFTDPAAFNYLDSDESAQANFAATDEQLLFVGHTHVPELRIIGTSGKVHTLPPQDFIAEDGKRYIVNVGSVGYPREANGRCMSSYVLYETETRTVRYRFLPFVVASLLQRGATTAPRLRRRWLKIAVGIIVTLLLGLGFAAFFALGPGEKPTAPSATPETTPTTTTTAKSLPLAEKSIRLSPSDRSVHANLKLMRKSPPAHLSIDFEDADGHALPPLAEIVPYWSHKAFDIPSGAVKATFRVRTTAEGAPPLLRSFAPAAD